MDKKLHLQNPTQSTKLQSSNTWNSFYPPVKHCDSTECALWGHWSVVSSVLSFLRTSWVSHHFYIESHPEHHAGALRWGAGGLGEVCGESRTACRERGSMGTGHLTVRLLGNEENWWVWCRADSCDYSRLVSLHGVPPQRDRERANAQ